MAKKKLVVGVVIALFSLALVWRLWFAQEEATVDETPLAVTVQRAATRDVSLPVTFTGSIEGTQSAVISSTASGRVVEVLVEDGTYVTKGTPLLRMDAVAANNAVRSATSSVRQARVKYDNDAMAYNRQAELYDQGAVAVQQLDAARTQMLVAESDLETAQATLADAQKQVADATVVSPVDGLVANRKVTRGQILSPSDAAMTVEQMNDVYVTCQVEQQYVAYIVPGLAVDVRVDAYPDRVFSGTVEIVNPAADKDSRMFLVKARVPNGDFALKPGMFVRVSITDQPEQMMLVPKTCVQTKKGLSYVYVAADGQARRVRVELGDDVGDDVQIVSGLADGDAVILDQIDRLQDGRAVTSNEKEEASA
ncbi:efflux RND transporter periplasmic adaptor subunit [uncultured Selenomonas sp.]|uniref:efflux RND transporter periplasmic adaptor subunit n=1 Tax=uncultured Selenomonas sp. TaxID=159275 RepID=UPI0025D4D259|nr:efflux RND transporter periplasmic adaptor subunit [uncultured Selenomonas sp.]